jgi:restriction endonuclease Mrr
MVASWLGVAWATHSLELGGILTLIGILVYLASRHATHAEQIASRVQAAQAAAALAWDWQVELTRAHTEALAEDERRHQLRTLDGWMKLSPVEFEQECARLLRATGECEAVMVTRTSGDGGVDIIFTRQGQRFAVQCKRYQGMVNPNDVRALVGVVETDTYAGGIFMTTGTFSTDTRRFAKKADLVLYDGQGLVDLARTARIIEQQVKAHMTAPAVPAAAPYSLGGTPDAHPQSDQAGTVPAEWPDARGTSRSRHSQRSRPWAWRGRMP